MGLRKGDGNEYVIDFQSKKLAASLWFLASALIRERENKKLGRIWSMQMYFPGSSLIIF